MYPTPQVKDLVPLPIPAGSAEALTGFVMGVVILVWFTFLVLVAGLVAGGIALLIFRGKKRTFFVAPVVAILLYAVLALQLRWTEFSIAGYY